MVSFELPESLVIGGKEYKIDTSWKTWANIAQAAQTDKSNAGKAAQMLLLCFGTNMPLSLGEAYKKMLWFYRRGKEPEREGEADARKVFDIIYDFPLVAAAFMSHYGIDLRESNMHWWQFWELFEGLGEDEKIIKVIGWRAARTGAIKNKEEKKYIRKMKALYALPDTRSEKEKDEAMMRTLEGVIG